MALTDEAIDKIKQMIISGRVRPGEKLPREADLAAELGLSRNSLREAVKALSVINVLDVRQGDGTYATSLAPSLLLEIGRNMMLRLVRSEPSVKRAIDDAAVVRQISFYSFERAVHTERKNGELTGERIGQLWLGVQGESLGPAIDIRPGYENFWMYIPHFIHSPFYVYAYAFGDCLVNSLYAVYEHAQGGFAERYLAMLAAGGTKHYSELLKPFGLDAKDPKFWDGGLSVIAGMIDELEELG